MGEIDAEKGEKERSGEGTERGGVGERGEGGVEGGRGDDKRGNIVQRESLSNNNDNKCILCF